MAEQKHTPNAMDVEEALSSSEAYLIKNKKLISGVILAVVVIVGGWLLYNHFIATPKELKAIRNLLFVLLRCCKTLTE